MSARFRKFLPVAAVGTLIIFAFSACETPGQTALLGAGTGAIIGNQSYTGSLRGAAIGAGVGYLVGKLVQSDRRRAYEEGYYEGRGERPYREVRYSSRSYRPVAQPTERRGIVISPYPPHRLIDTRGIPHGAPVLDPAARRIFTNP